MQTPSICPKCKEANPYFDGALWICPDCNYEWNPSAAQSESPTDESLSLSEITDAFGNRLTDGDSVTVIKDLKIKGSSNAVKVGTKVKNIRLVDSNDGHNISCKVDGFGALNLKSEFVKKS